MLTYLLYNFILVTAGSFAYLAEHGNTRQFRFASRIAVFLVLWIPAALRYNTGTDYMAYVATFNNTYTGIIEGGYKILNDAIRFLGLSVQWIFVFTSFLVYFPICFVLKRRHYFLVILFYILLFFYLRSYNIVRQAIAVSFVTGALVYLDDKKYFRAVCFMAFAISIHVSALLVLPLLLLKLIRFRTRTFPVFLMFFGMIIFYRFEILDLLFLILKITGSKYYRYSSYISGDSFHLQGGTVFTFLAMIVRSATVFIAVFFIPGTMRKNKKINFLFNMSIVYNYVNVLSLRYVIIARIREILMWVPVLASGYAVQPLKKYRKIIIYAVILLNIGLFEFTIQQNNRETIGASIYPYYSIFSKDR
jgi:hypothetical protein